MTKRYEKYKDSGSAWIGEIPDSWEATTFRYFINILTDYTANGSFGDLSKNVEYIGHKSYARLIRLTDLREDLNNANGVWVNEKAYNYLSKSSLYGGELLLANVGAYSGYSCIMPKVDYPATLAPNMFLIKQYKKDLNTKYLWHLLSSKMFFNYLQIVALSSAQPKLNKENIRQTPIVIPPIIEQEQIAKYLDWKCGEVDRIVEVRERQIKLLAELLTSIISRAVTRGLNPNAPLKDSGIDWIGQIPEHWEVRKISRIFSKIGSGTTPKSGNEDYYAENGENWLQTGDLNDSYINDTSKKITIKALDDHSLRFYPEGSIVMAMYGATIGKLGLLNIKTTTNQACCVMAGNKVYHSKYGFNTLLAARTHILTLAYGGGQPNISQDTIKTIKLPVPTIDEQQQIADYLDKKTAEIDSAIDKFKVQIDKLKEYRQALITEVVTGKIDVRGIEIPTPKSN